MKKPLPPITWFRAFDATARHLSFTRAAQELGFTQSAISQNVRALEDKLGTPLFVRGHRALSLTEAGRLLVSDVAAAMAHLEQATERFLPPVTRPKLTVAASVSVAQWLITPRLAEFMTQHPDIALQLSTTIWPDDFASTSADVEIRFGSKSVVGRDAELLEPSMLHVVAAPSVAAAFDKKPDWALLSDACLIQPVGISSGWTDMAKKLGHGDHIEPQLLVDTHGLAVDLAVAGVGVALTHTQITQHALKSQLLVELPFPRIPADEGYYVARRGTAHPDVQDHFIKWLLSDSQQAI